MNLISTFRSDCYKPIKWNEALKHIAKPFFTNENTFGLLNSQNIALIISNTDSTDISLLSANGLLIMDKSALDKIESPEQSMQSLFYVNSNAKIISNIASPSMKDFINALLHYSIEAAKTIFSYTYSHLSNRQYGEKNILQIETVQNQFANLVVVFEGINSTLCSNEAVEKSGFMFSQLIEIFKELSRLGGARAVLKDNAIDYLCHLKLLLQFID